MGKKKIGIPGFYRNDMFGVHPDYLHFVERFGTPVIITPTDRKEFFHKYKGLEGIILPGGADVDPARYAKNAIHHAILVNWFCYPPDSTLEHFDTEILPGLIHAGFPVFGICRGLQTLNVHYGGTLRNVDWHKQSKKKDDLIHEIEFTSGYVGKVNSFHHQAIGRLAESLQQVAWTEGNIIEVVKHHSLPVAAVQYHPERFEDEWSIATCEKLFA